MYRSEPTPTPRDGGAVGLGLTLDGGDVYAVKNIEPSQTAVGPCRIRKHQVGDDVKPERIDPRTLVWSHFAGIGRPTLASLVKRGSLKLDPR